MGEPGCCPVHLLPSRHNKVAYSWPPPCHVALLPQESRKRQRSGGNVNGGGSGAVVDGHSPHMLRLDPDIFSQLRLIAGQRSPIEPTTSQDATLEDDAAILDAQRVRGGRGY